jgi:hypothetical protein
MSSDETQACERTGCRVKFKPGPPTKRFCSKTCRVRAHRDGLAAEESVAADQRKGHAEHELVTAVRTELEACGQTMTVKGQIALQLARRMVDPSDPAVDRLAEKLETLVDKCKAAGGKTPPDGAGPAQAQPAAEEDDEVEQARRARELKLAAAADGREVGPEVDRA